LIDKLGKRIEGDRKRLFDYAAPKRGHVFQDVFRAIKIETNEQLMVVTAYIHTNSLSLKYPKWKEIRIENPKEAMKFLEEYKWLCRDAHKYGFVLSYPRNNSVGMSFEPWHWRYESKSTKYNK